VIELTHLPGLDEFVKAEVKRLPGARRIRPVPGRDDAIECTLTGTWAPLLALRTVAAAFVVLDFDVPRPRSLTSGDHLARITGAIESVVNLNRRQKVPKEIASFRFEAAGSDSPVFARLATDLARATRLKHDPQQGDLVLRVRPQPREGQGWQVLVRLSPRPLSDRDWRRVDLPGAVNAAIAASIALASEPKPGDRVANLMAGSGSLLIERLLIAPVRQAVAVDSDAAAIEACSANVAAAGLRAHVLREDIADDGWLARGPFDVLLADPPWGHLVGDRRNGQATHELLLRRAAQAAAPGARLLVLTHEIAVMKDCLDRTRDLWRSEREIRVFQKGHHPRIFVLRAVR